MAIHDSTRDKIQAFLDRYPNGRTPAPDVKPRPVATVDQHLARKLNWSMLQMRGARAALSSTHTHAWGHPALRTAIAAIDEAIECMEQYNTTERFLRKRFDAALIPGAAGSNIVESWVDGTHTASIQRHRRPGARSAYRVVGFDGITSPETYARVSTARRGLQDHVLANLRDPVRFPRSGDLWFHPDLGMHCVRDVILDDFGHLAVRCHYSGDGSRWNGQCTIDVLDFVLPIKSTPPQWFWGYEGRFRATATAAGIHRTASRYAAGIHRNVGEYRCIPNTTATPEGWLRAEGLSQSLLAWD